MDPAPPQPGETDRDDTLALKKLLYFQFFVMTGLVAFVLPGALALDGAPLGDFLTGFYGAALCMHAFFLWRLWVLEPRFRGHYLAVLGVVLLVPWISWVAKRHFDLDAAIVGSATFVIIVIMAFLTLSKRGRSA